MVKKKKNRLQKAFEYVRTTFFPRWDKENQWTVSEVPELPSQGKCERVTKTISLRYLPEKDDDLYVWLIHEICHTSDPGHGKRWSNRMLRVANRAKAKGHNNLVKKICDDKEAFRSAKPLSAREVYQEIEDAGLKATDWSYDDIINWVAKQYGCSREELEKRFKRCRTVYDEALRLYGDMET